MCVRLAALTRRLSSLAVVFAYVIMARARKRLAKPAAAKRAAPYAASSSAATGDGLPAPSDSASAAPAPAQLLLPGAARVLVLGLDGAGKTAIASAFSGKGWRDLPPTSGFQVSEALVCDLCHVTFVDLGGSAAIRPYWHHYCKPGDRVLFVVDSTAQERFAESTMALMNVLMQPALLLAPIMLVASKQNAPDALPPAEVASRVAGESLSTSNKFFRGHAGLGEPTADAVTALLVRLLNDAPPEPSSAGSDNDDPAGVSIDGVAVDTTGGVAQ